jgi:DNA-binding NarL/FixJ family response regulator
MMEKRIFIACADERLRMALFLLLESEPGMIVVGITDRLSGFIIQLEATQPDVLLLEWKLTSQKMADLLADIRNLECSPKVLFFSNKPSEKEKILGDGADYFILKDSPPDQLLPILNNINHLKQ